MEIIPALYLHDQKVVSWYKGFENEQKKVYSGQPLNFIKKFLAAGAQKIHLVDLNKSENPHDHKNKDLIHKIISSTNLTCQIAGGLNNENDLADLLKYKNSAVVVGYSARKLIPKLLQHYGDQRIFAGIKAKKNLILSQDLIGKQLEVLDYSAELIKSGVKKIIYKDLESEGTLYPHYDETDRLIMTTAADIYLSGGISTESQLEILKKIGLKGAIISKAFLERKLSLSQTIHEFA